MFCHWEIEKVVKVMRLTMYALMNINRSKDQINTLSLCSEKISFWFGTKNVTCVKIYLGKKNLKNLNLKNKYFLIKVFKGK